MGKIGGLRAAWIDSDDHDLIWVAALSLFDAFEDYRMTVGGVGPDEEKTIGKIDVGVRNRWTVRSERHLITGRGRCHTKAGVGVEIVRAEETLGQLVANIILLGGQLARPIKRHCVRTVVRDDGAKALRQEFKCRIP